MIEQIALIMVMFACLLVASLITIAFALIFINVLCVGGYVLLRLKNIAMWFIQKVTGYMPDDVLGTLSSVVFAPAYWALKKIDDENRRTEKGKWRK